MVKIDLKGAYFTVPLAINSRKYIRFLWEGNLYEKLFAGGIVVEGHLENVARFGLISSLSISEGKRRHDDNFRGVSSRFDQICPLEFSALEEEALDHDGGG